MNSFLQKTDPMGIYQMLYAFMEASGKYMGEPGTHPWSQGFPLTSQLPGGPPLPDSVKITAPDLKYPKAWGHDSLRERIADYYCNFYGSNITAENVMIFAGGRAALFAVMFLLRKDIGILVEETEYTPYYDLLKILERSTHIIPSNESNNFLPDADDYKKASPDGPYMCLRSNPCNPTGQVMQGARLQALVDDCSRAETGALIDEAYEFFASPEPISAMSYIEDIDKTNIFIAAAATKGLQAPGIRLGWVIASKENVATLSNYSTFGMGGVSRLSQLYGEELLKTDRVSQARDAVCKFYDYQRSRYGEALSSLGLKLFTGNGGFYHWAKLPEGMNADELNQRLFKRGAAILPGRLCDMHRRTEGSPFDPFFRFSFGPLTPDSFEEDAAILRSVLEE